MSFETILWERKNGIGRLTLNRPERLNAFSPKMHAELRSLLSDIAEDTETRVIVITGAGRGFCSGADLAAGQLETTPEGPDLGLALERDYNPLIQSIQNLEKPIIAAVNGPAAGAGMSLALACDFTVAAESATFLQAFCNIGLVPDAGSTFFLPRLVGQARAAYLAMLGEKIPAKTAADWGLIWKSVPDDQFEAEISALATRLAAGPTKALGLIKRALHQSWKNDLAQQLDMECRSQREAGRTRDFFEGVQAFLMKRPAKFRGQ